MNTVFQSHQIPVILQYPDGRKFKDPNDCICSMYDTVDKFIELNVTHENSKHFLDHYRNSNLGYGTGRIVQRRRRRGTVNRPR